MNRVIFLLMAYAVILAVLLGLAGGLFDKGNPFYIRLLGVPATGLACYWALFGGRSIFRAVGVLMGFRRAP